MLAIVQRSLVRERYYEIERAGLNIERMGVSSEGVLNWFVHRVGDKTEEQAVALVDVDSFYTEVLVVHHRKVLFTKSILVGAKQLAESPDESIGQLTTEIQSAMRAARAEMRDTEIKSIVLSGAGVHVQGLQEKIGEVLSLPCEALDCLSDVRLGKGVSDLGDPRYASASLTGLIGVILNPDALRFNLVPDVVRMRKQMMRSALAFSALAGGIVSVMIFASLYAVLAWSYRANKLDELNKAIQDTSPGVTRIERMIEVIREANARQDSRFSVVNLLPEIHSCVPKDMYFETVDVDQEARRVSLGGTAAARKDIRELIKLLEDSSLFEQVQEDGRVTMDSEKRLQFKVVASFEEGS
jgi:Tfp pilus assembly protein PilN